MVWPEGSYGPLQVSPQKNEHIAQETGRHFTSCLDLPLYDFLGWKFFPSGFRVFDLIVSVLSGSCHVPPALMSALDSEACFSLV